MNNLEKIVFVDETGDEQLNLGIDGVSDFYILTAIVIEPNRKEDVSLHFESVRRQYFRGTEMKSTVRRLKNKPELREQILKALSNIEFSLYLYAVDKSKLNIESGLKYPKSFIKYFHKKLYNRILEDHSYVHLICDEIKGRKFCLEFEQYIKKVFDADGERLFYPFDIKLVNSKEDVCIQATDFIAGAIAQSFENKTSKAYHDKHKKILSSHIIDFNVFPEIYSPYTIEDTKSKWNKFDSQIEARSLYDSAEFIKKHFNSEDENLQKEVFCLQILRQSFFQEGSYNWVSTDHLLSILGFNGEQALRAMIGRLRDAGIAVVSRHLGGYKLATSKADYCEFLNIMNTQISPMINRIKTARNIVLRATDRKIDILEEPEYNNLKLIADLDNLWQEPEE